MELVLVRDGGTPLDDEARGFLATLEFPYILVERDDPPEGLALARDRGIERVRGVSTTIRIHSDGLSALTPDRLTDRKRFLDELSRRHGLGPIEPKTFWEVAGTLCPDGNATRR